MANPRPFRSAFRRIGTGLVLALSVAPGAARGQLGGDCDVPNHRGFVTLSLSNGSRITYFSYPTIVCSGNTRISADSAVVYEATNYTQLYNHVVFQDADTRLTADQAHYFDQERRLRAWGQVRINDLAEGSIIRGDTILLLRAEIGRPEDQLTVWGMRPHATLYPTRQPVAEDTLGGEVPPPPPPSQADRKPYEIYSRTMFLEGSRYFRATGGVTMNRDSVDAVADSVEYDETLGALFLARDARLTTGGFDLSAETIRLDIPQDDIRSVLAREQALLEGEDLWLLAPTISLMLTEGKVERLIAVQAPPEDSLAQPRDRRGRPVPDEVREMGLDLFPDRPHAFAQDFLLWADSIEVLAPGEVLDEVWAMGKAHGESLSRDSLNTPDTDPLFRRDWLEGDTIVAIFVPDADSASAEVGVPEDEVARPRSAGAAGQGEAQPDSAKFRLDRLVARVDARSLYRLAPTDSTLVEEEDHRLAIHYVMGSEITIIMKEGEVDRMEVSGQTRGIHLEPMAIRRRPIPPDTTAVSPPGGNPGGRN